MKKFSARLWQELKNYKSALVFSLTFSVFSVLGTLVLPVFYGKITDAIVSEGNVDFKAMLIFAAFALGTILLVAVCERITDVLGNKMANGVTKNVRNAAFKALQNAPLKNLDRRSVGDVLSVEIGDADKMADGLLLGFSKFFTGILTIIGTLICLFSINYLVALVVAIITPVSVITAKFITERTYKHFTAQTKAAGKQSALIEESFSNLNTLKANNCEREFENKFTKANSELRGAAFNAVFYSSLTNPTTRFINAAVYLAVTFVSALLAIKTSDSAISAGVILSLLSYVNRYTKPFNEITSVLTEITAAKASAERLFAIIDGETETDGEIESEITGNVEMDRVSFSYDKSRELIKDLSLKVERGTKVAIVGPTGAGKSTLINLLMRFYDVDGGKITVDGIDERNYRRVFLRRNFGMVLQETWIRKGTIRENLTLGKKDASEEEILSACKAASLDGFISRLSLGLDTVIDEDGLSQGQKQLICIARVMLVSPPVLILDEATSNIDTMTEMRIQSAFYALTKGKTSFIVAHRLSTIRSADVILVMDKGNVVEQGTHAQLLEKGGLYKEIYDSQFEGET